MRVAPAQTRKLVVLEAGPRVHRARRARRGALDGLIAIGERAQVLLAEASRQHAVDDDRIQLASQQASQPALELDGLSHRHLGRLRDGHVARACRVDEQLPHAVCLLGDGADPRDCPERARGLQHRQRVACGRRVDHHQVVAGRSPPPAPALRQLPDLDHADELFGPRCSRGEVLKRAARGEHAPRDATTEHLQPFQQCPVGINGEAPEPLIELVLHTRIPSAKPEQCRQLLALADLHHDRAQAPARSEQARRGGDGRLASTSLARDHEQLA